MTEVHYVSIQPSVLLCTSGAVQSTSALMYCKQHCVACCAGSTFAVCAQPNDSVNCACCDDTYSNLPAPSEGPGAVLADHCGIGCLDRDCDCTALLLVVPPVLLTAACDCDGVKLT
jgi:hypothetical protein